MNCWNTVTTGLFILGYPVAILVIARFVPVVRERRVRWFGAHQLAVAAIVTGWVIRSSWPAVTVNSAWLGAAAVWYVRRPGVTPVDMADDDAPQ